MGVAARSSEIEDITCPMSGTPPGNGILPPQRSFAVAGSSALDFSSVNHAQAAYSNVPRPEFAFWHQPPIPESLMPRNVPSSSAGVAGFSAVGSPLGYAFGKTSDNVQDRGPVYRPVNLTPPAMPAAPTGKTIAGLAQGSELGQWFKTLEEAFSVHHEQMGIIGQQISALDRRMVGSNQRMSALHAKVELLVETGRKLLEQTRELGQEMDRDQRVLSRLAVTSQMSLETMDETLTRMRDAWDRAGHPES